MRKTRVKVLKFTVSNLAYRPSESILKYVKDSHREELESPEDIENIVNDELDYLHFLNYRIDDIVVTTVVPKQHNNGGSDTVELYYTIRYSIDDAKKEE